MERIISKIFRMKLIVAALCLIPAMTLHSTEEGLATATLKNFIMPQFNSTTKKLEYILTGTDAKSSGAAIQLNNVRLEFIGADGKTIKAVITTPQASYNQATNFISGDKLVKYNSLPFDAEGVGFDASQVTQTMHIRKQVKMTIKSMEGLGDGLSGNFSPSMFAFSESLDSAFSSDEKSHPRQESSNSDTTQNVKE